METYNFTPSELIYLFLDGEHNSVERTVLFRSMADNQELQHEFEDALKIRTAALTESLALVPSAALTQSLMARAGFATAGVALGSAAVARSDLRQLDDLVQLRVVGGHVEQSRRESQRSLLHADFDEPLHLLEFGRRGRAVLEAQHFRPHPRVTGEEPDVGRHLQRCHVLIERPRLVAAVEAREDRGDPLPREVLRQRVLVDRRLDVRVVVDEAWRDDEARRVELARRLIGRDAVAIDPGDPIALDGDISLDRGRTGAVDDGAAANDEVVGRSAPGLRARGERRGQDDQGDQ